MPGRRSIHGAGKGLAFFLPRLVKENFRFQIETDLSNHRNRSTAPINDARIRRLVHVDHVEASRRIRRSFSRLGAPGHAEGQGGPYAE